MPAGAFAALLLHHQRLRALRGLAERAVAYHRRALERLRGTSAGEGAGGAAFGDPHHRYSADLDLFGTRSVFQLLCTARTAPGESTLARWLLAPAGLETIRERHACIRELRERHDLREDLQIQGDTPRIALRPAALQSWAEASEDRTLGRALRTVAQLLAAGAIATAAAWGMGGPASPFLAVLVIEAGIARACRHRVQAAVAGVEHAYEDIRLLATLLRRIEREPFEAPALRSLGQRLSSDALSAAETLSDLATIVNFVEARRNPFLAPLLLPLMYNLQAACAAERWRHRHGAAVSSWLRVLGDIEALESLASYSFDHPSHPFPEFLEGDPAFMAGQLGHPLLPQRTCIRNDVELSAHTRVLLVSGSNMSGKSTLLRAVGINAVLAMAGAPVCAARLQLTPLQVGASIRLNDSLQEGSSRFYAEITRLRQLFEPAPLPLLFLLDELLQGTNSADRRIGARGVLRALLERGAIGLVSTHDLSLTDDAVGALRNVHFQDELRNGRLEFDFTLRDGVVTRSNGVELMRAIGLEV